jgi:glycosyltransferase involved in cell wall biosynthesis
MSVPSISVIIPVFNSAGTLPRALESVVAQDMAELEVIVVDDGSTDKSAEVAERLLPSAKVLRQKNGGPSAARNRGLRDAGGDWIAFLDADDAWTPGSLRARAEALGGDQSWGYVIGRTQFVKEDGTPSGNNEVQKGPWTSPNLGSGLFRRELFAPENIGLFAEDLRNLQDIDWFWRAQEAGVALGRIEAVTLWYYRHDHGTTAGKGWEERRLTEVIRRSLQRRRARSLAGPLPLLGRPGNQP